MITVQSLRKEFHEFCQTYQTQHNVPLSAVALFIDRIVAKHTISITDVLTWIDAHPRTVFQVRFIKTDGTPRLMRCQTGFDDGTLVKNPLKNKPDFRGKGLIGVYDEDKKEYRSFRIDSIRAIVLGDDGNWLEVVQ